MFRITRNLSLGNSIQCLAKITVIVVMSVDMDVVGVTAAYSWCVCVLYSLESVSLDCNFSQALYRAP